MWEIAPQGFVCIEAGGSSKLVCLQDEPSDSLAWVDPGER